MYHSILIILTLLFFKPAMVNAAHVLRFTYGQTSRGTCNESDNVVINSIFTPKVGRHHQRRLTGNAQPRELLTVSAICKKSCQYVAVCHVKGCLGVRRELESKPESVHPRDLLTQGCTDEINSVNMQLDNLITTGAISSSCSQVLIPQNRGFTCVDDAVESKIFRTRFLNLTTPTAPVVLRRTRDVCRSMVFTIESYTLSCLDNGSVYFKIVGPPGFTTREYTESVEPFTLNGAKDGVLNGMKLSILGNYEVTIIPDRSPASAGTLKFLLLDC